MHRQIMIAICPPGTTLASIILTIYKNKMFSRHIDYPTLSRYLLYMVMSCAVTAGMNILHTKYVLEIQPRYTHFIVPVIAGIIFGYMLARVRGKTPLLVVVSDITVYARYIIMACFVTAILNVIHTEWVLGRKLEDILFIAPLVAGVFFGYLLARIKILNNRLEELATTDPLTKVYNRAQFERFLEIEKDRVKRYKTSFSLVFIDIDFFKAINDEYGHVCCDQVLVRIAECLRDSIRQTDMLARYGGDEFVILVTDTNLKGALLLAERIRIALSTTVFAGVNRVTCSQGVAEMSPDSPANFDISRRADEALYRAKQGGRNQVST